MDASPYYYAYTRKLPSCAEHGKKEHGHTTRIQKHGRALHAVFWFISTMLLRHTGLVNKVQKYITQT